jgi:hypothetical protein
MVKYREQMNDDNNLNIEQAADSIISTISSMLTV